ncbi:hypothetical protein H4R19_001216 [Coemansia spiralis]|nr:hypothetical protein H4R19_001216 [Coemansia spiralis]
MAPPQAKSAQKGIGKEFLCKVRYQNPLPPVPFPPKLLPVPPTYVDASVGSYTQARLQHYVEYRHTTLEEATPYPLFVDADYGMPIDPCILGAFDDEDDAARHRVPALDKEDEFLLNLPTPAAPHAPNRESEASGAGTPAAVPASQPARMAAAAAHRATGTAKRVFDHSLEGQLRAIDESFAFFARYGTGADSEAALLRDLKHPTNSSLHAVEALPLFPDTEIWPNSYTVFSLDVCPEPEFVAKMKPEPAADEQRRLGDAARDSLVFRPRVRPNNLGENEQWIETFLPEDADTAARLAARLAAATPASESDVGVEYRLDSSREYDVPVRPATHRQDLYMLAVDAGRGEGARAVAQYVPIRSRVLLKRRAAPLAGRQYEMADDPLRITNLDLQLRDFSEEELQERAAAADRLHEIIKEEVVRTSTARHDEDDEHVDVGDGLFDSDSDDGATHSRSRRPPPSYSPSPSP